MAGGPDRWQIDDSTGITISIKRTYENGATTSETFERADAWISGNSDGFKKADIVIYCDRQRGPVFKFREEVLRKRAASPTVKIAVDGRIFRQEARPAESTNLERAYEFLASKRLIGALKKGSRVTVNFYGEDIGSYKLRGSSKAIKEALRGCRFRK